MLVDESRDKSIKEQIALVFRYVPTFLFMFHYYLVMKCHLLTAFHVGMSMVKVM